MDTFRAIEIYSSHANKKIEDSIIISDDGTIRIDCDFQDIFNSLVKIVEGPENIDFYRQNWEELKKDFESRKFLVEGLMNPESVTQTLDYIIGIDYSSEDQADKARERLNPVFHSLVDYIEKISPVHELDENLSVIKHVLEVIRNSVIHTESELFSDGGLIETAKGAHKAAHNASQDTLKIISIAKSIKKIAEDIPEAITNGLEDMNSPEPSFPALSEISSGNYEKGLTLLKSLDDGMKGTAWYNLQTGTAKILTGDIGEALDHLIYARNHKNELPERAEEVLIANIDYIHSLARGFLSPESEVQVYGAEPVVLANMAGDKPSISDSEIDSEENEISDFIPEISENSFYQHKYEDALWDRNMEDYSSSLNLLNELDREECNQVIYHLEIGIANLLEGKLGEAVSHFEILHKNHAEKLDEKQAEVLKNNMQYLGKLFQTGTPDKIENIGQEIMVYGLVNPEE